MWLVASVTTFAGIGPKDCFRNNDVAGTAQHHVGNPALPALFQLILGPLLMATT